MRARPRRPNFRSKPRTTTSRSRGARPSSSASNADAPERYRFALITMIVEAESEPSALRVPVAATRAPAARLVSRTVVVRETFADAGTATVVAAPLVDATETDESVTPATEPETKTRPEAVSRTPPRPGAPAGPSPAGVA